MRSTAARAGVAALAFSVLTIVGLIVANPVGGNYSADDAAKYISRGHHVAVFVGAYLLLLGTIGLIWLLAYLREVAFADPTKAWLGRLFWGSGLAAATSLAVGWSLIIGVATATAFGGHSLTVAPNVTFMLVETGSAVVWGAGAFLLGFALFVLVAGSGTTFPAWLRWATAIGAIGGITAMAFFPSALVLLWGIAIGVWLLMRPRTAEPAV
jgi:hypothetical protein